jgi:glyoxylase-like metal-dependent hydrolase (beta-lactamase superfamily II)
MMRALKQKGDQTMKRLAVLLGLLLVGAISLTAARKPQQGAPVKLEIQNVKENLFMISGGGGNTAVFITEKGVVLVDTKNPGMGPGILEKVKSVTPKPVMMVINTHTHGDHVGSNSAFTGAVEFIAHENCKASMEKMPMFQAEENKKFLPGKTYRDKLSVLTGKEKIDLYYFGRGHTHGDTFVVFPALKVMHSGDIFAGKMTPFIDANNGGSGLEFPKTLAKAAAGIKGVETIIPGHSAVLNWNDFKEYGEFMRDMVAAIQQAKKAGKTAEQIESEVKLPEKYNTFGMGRWKADVAQIYAELK